MLKFKTKVEVTGPKEANTPLFKQVIFFLAPRNTKQKGKLSTFDHLIKVQGSLFCKKANNVCNIKSSWFKLVKYKVVKYTGSSTSARAPCLLMMAGNPPRAEVTDSGKLSISPHYGTSYSHEKVFLYMPMKSAPINYQKWAYSWI